jgi:hypothetical protein
MHFLDVVFPLQYPMYRSGITEGGRGWLLSLLFHTKPLYHAALGLSAYHRGTVLLAEQRVGCHAIAATEKETHLALCLTDFQQSIKKVGRWVKESCPENVIGIMACVVQLVFFEVGVSTPLLNFHTHSLYSFSQVMEIRGRFIFEQPQISIFNALPTSRFRSFKSWNHQGTF